VRGVVVVVANLTGELVSSADAACSVSDALLLLWPARAGNNAEWRSSTERSTKASWFLG